MMNPMKGSSKKLTEIIEGKSKKKKGHFVVYSKDSKRFLIPLCYLNHSIFRVLLEMAEEEYGLAVHDGPLQVPCEKELMEFILCLLRTNPSEELVDEAFSSGGTYAFRERQRGATQYPVDQQILCS